LFQMCGNNFHGLTPHNSAGMLLVPSNLLLAMEWFKSACLCKSRVIFANQEHAA
jgi:hypothetical protein